MTQFKISQSGVASLLFVIIALAGISLGVFLLQNYTSFLPKASSEDEATLVLEPSIQRVDKGCEVSLNINVTTGFFLTNGTDAVLKYNPEIVTVQSVENGMVYPSYPGNSIDNVKGVVRITGLASPTNPISGSGKLASVKLKINPQTQEQIATISFDFDPNDTFKTSDSNIVENSTISDVLNSVTNAQINIGSGNSCSGIPTPSPSLVPVSKPQFSVSLETIKNHYRATVSWDIVPAASVYDKIEVISVYTDSSRKSLLKWVYTANCTSAFPRNDSTPKEKGSCKLTLPKLKGNYEFKFYQATGSTVSK